MKITLPKDILTALLQDAAELGAEAALAKTGALKPYMSKHAAFKMYGRSNVERWINQGHITPRKDGNNTAGWRIDRIEIEAVAMASNRHSYNLITTKQ